MATMVIDVVVRAEMVWGWNEVAMDGRCWEGRREKCARSRKGSLDALMSAELPPGRIGARCHHPGDNRYPFHHHRRVGNVQVRMDCLQQWPWDDTMEGSAVIRKAG
jgi:hypothetical protein